MKKTFGTNPSNPNHHVFNQSQGGSNGRNFRNLLNDPTLNPNHGIFTMTPIDPVSFGASGHCDIYNGSICAAGCYFSAASEINIWILN